MRVHQESGQTEDRAREEWFRQRILSLIHVYLSERAHRDQSQLRFISQYSSPQVKRADYVQLGFGEETKIRISSCDRFPNRCFDKRLLIELSLKSFGGSIQRRSNFKIRIRFDVWPRLFSRAGLSQHVAL